MSNRYRDDSRAGLANPVLQRGLRMIQDRFGKGAMRLWQEMEDQGLRARAKEQRMQTLAHLDLVLARFADKVRENGGTVYFAETAADAVEYTRSLAVARGVRSVVKGKSMTSMEVGIDPVLEAEGIEVVETDLGEYIIQLAGQLPSHIIAPCIHLGRREIGQLFTEKLAIDYTENPPELTRAARKALRDKLLAADMGLTGCNLACAETGQIALVSNEGNIRMATTMPRIHVAFMGMERIASTLDEHRELLQLLTRGAALQKLSTYVSFIGGPDRQSGDGPGEFHLVIIDNGRTRILADDDFREVLACIRCGACLNVCPVYGKIGGHAYNSPYCGPIGAVVTPLMMGVNEHADLCKGETLCGACKDVCPVNNDLPRMLAKLRHLLAYGDKGWGVRPHDRVEATAFRLWAGVISSRRTYMATLKSARVLQKLAQKKDGMLTRLPGAGAGWTRDRDLVPVAARTFGERWQERIKKMKGGAGDEQ